MTEYRLADRAEADMFELSVYGYRQFGTRRAEAYAAGLDHTFQLLAENPQMGRAAHAIRPGVRRHEHRSHVILYEEAPHGVLIFAVVHGSSVRRLSL